MTKTKVEQRNEELKKKVAEREKEPKTKVEVAVDPAPAEPAPAPEKKQAPTPEVIPATPDTQDDDADDLGDDAGETGGAQADPAQPHPAKLRKEKQQQKMREEITRELTATFTQQIEALKAQYATAQPPAPQMHTQPAVPEKPKPRPDMFLDPEGYEKWQEERYSERLQQALQPLLQSQMQSRLETVATHWDAQRASLQGDGEFEAARQHLLDAQRQKHKAQHPQATDAQIDQQLRLDEAMFVADLSQQYQTPQAMAYAIKSIAYNNPAFRYTPTPVQDEAQEAVRQPSLNEQRTMKASAPPSLIGIGTGGGASGKTQSIPSLKEWNAMSNEKKIAAKKVDPSIVEKILKRKA